MCVCDAAMYVLVIVYILLFCLCAMSIELVEWWVSVARIVLFFANIQSFFIRNLFPRCFLGLPYHRAEPSGPSNLQLGPHL